MRKGTKIAALLVLPALWACGVPPRLFDNSVEPGTIARMQAAHAL